MLKLIATIFVLFLLFIGNNAIPVFSKSYSNTNFIKNEDNVLICISASAYAYHTHYCSGLKRCTHEVAEVTVDEAKSKGYKACNICY